MGIAAVVLLSSIGEGTKRFIVGQLAQFGTDIIAVYPGKTETGGLPGHDGRQHAQALARRRARDRATARAWPAWCPTVSGTAVCEYGGRSRRTYVFGASPQVPAVFSMKVAQGEFFPPMDYDRAASVAVLGPRLKRELFGDANPLGAAMRIGQWRFRVVGVMESKGQILGFDLDDCVWVPVASAMRLLNRPEIDELDVLAASSAEIDPVAERIRRLLFERHDRREDFTLMTQKEGQEMVGRVLDIVTIVVTSIAAISLLVGAIGILTIMWIVVRERTAEIGLVKALGATQGQILVWYLFEAGATSLAGGVAGLLVGGGGAWLLRAAVPGLESYTSPATVALALGVALAVGVAAGVAPALHAAQLDPVEALRGE